jgi:transposase InsO family protein
VSATRRPSYIGGPVKQFTLYYTFDKTFCFIDGLKVLRKSSLKQAVYQEFAKSKKSEARYIAWKLRRNYIGCSVKTILNTLSVNPTHQLMRLKFHNKAPLRPVVAIRVMERLQIDLIDKCKEPSACGGKTVRYILTVMDVFSRYSWLRPLKNKSSLLVSKELRKLFNQFGFPRIVQSDRGCEFQGKVSQLLKAFKIRHIVSAPYHPQSQGKVE